MTELDASKLIEYALNANYDVTIYKTQDFHMRLCSTSVGGVKVSIVAFQAIDPGSIPG